MALVQRMFRRLLLFLAFVLKEQLLYREGQPCSLDEVKVRKLTAGQRKSTGGGGLRKKWRRVYLRSSRTSINGGRSRESVHRRGIIY